MRCEPPRLLKVTWTYGDRPADEVDLRLSSEDGGTLLELEHATVSTLVEWEGRRVDVIPGVGAGWEPALAALHEHLGDGEPSPADFDALSDRVAREWAALLGS